MFTDSVSGYVKPTPPEGVTASKAEYDDKIVVSWTKVGKAVRYNIRRYSVFGDSTDYSREAGELTTSGDTVFFDNNQVDKGYPYVYRVNANLGEIGKTEYSDISTDNKQEAATGYTKMPKVENIKATDGKFEDSIVVTWDSVAAAESYQVYRVKADGTDTTTWTVQSSRAVNLKQGALVDGVKYKYWVAAQRGSDLSANSIADSDTGWLAISGPAVVEASRDLIDSIQVTWDELTAVDDVTGYQVWRQMDQEAGEVDVKLADVSYSERSYKYFVAPDEVGDDIDIYIKGVSAEFGVSCKSQTATGYTKLNKVKDFEATPSSVENSIHLN